MTDKHYFHQVKIVVAAIATTFFLCHCANRHYRPPVWGDRYTNEGVYRVLQQLRLKNSLIQRIKGIGTLQLQHGNTLQKLRAAWIGEFPNHLRLELMGVTGQPVASLASDGIWNYFIFHPDKKYVQRRVTENDLGRIISLPLSAEALLHFLCGRVSIKEGGEGWMLRGEDDEMKELVYKETEASLFQHIYYDSSTFEVHHIELKNETGDLMLQVSFGETEPKDSPAVPSFLSITNNRDITLKMRIDKTWINPTINPGTFRLERTK